MCSVALWPVVRKVSMCKVRCLLAFCYLGYNFLWEKKRLNHISELEI